MSRAPLRTARTLSRSIARPSPYSTSTLRKMVVQVEDLETLSAAYASDPPSASQSQSTPSASLNDRISIWRGDITKLAADMIVNAANKSLLGGGGVDGAIHRAAGSALLEECETLGGAETGETKVTDGYRLPAKRIAHTVGPIYSERRKEEVAAQLESCYRTSLEACAKYGGGSIGFASISTGIYGYPIEEATHIALRTTRTFLENNDSVTRVVYVVFSAADEEVYRRLAPEYFPPA